MLTPIHPLVAYIRTLPGSWYLTSEVADAVGCSPTTLRRLARVRGDLAPSHSTTYGRLHVDLYDDADVERLAGYLRDQQSERGRPRLWTDAERRQRRKAHSAAGYHRRRATLLAASGRIAEAANEDQLAVRVVEELRQQAFERAANSGVGRI